MRTTNRKILKIGESTHFYPRNIMTFDFYILFFQNFSYFFGPIENTAENVLSPAVFWRTHFFKFDFMITYAGKFYNIAEYNDTFVVHLRLSCKKSHKKCFFLIYITIVRIDENKAYRHGGLYTSGRGQLIIFFYHSNGNTNRVFDNQSYLWKKVFKYTKTLFFNCVLQNTAGHKGLYW